MMNEDALTQMESQLEHLITRCQDLQSENVSLREQQERWEAEKSDFAQKNLLARSRIEALIKQLRQLEAQCGADH